MVRKRFLWSGATVCLMLTSGLAYAQSPGDTRRDEPKKDRLEKSEPAKAGQSRSESRPEERTRERSESNSERGNPSARQTGEEHRPSTSTQHTGSPRQDEQNRARNEGSQQDERNRARTEGSKQNQQDRARTDGSKQDERNRARSEGAKQNERADESRRKNREEGDKASSPADKSAKDQSGREKSTQQSDKSNSGAAPNESSQSQRGEATKASPTQSQSRESATPTSRTGAANETDRSRMPNEAQRGAGGGSQTNTSTSTSDKGRLSRDKEVRISETMRSRELAAPERNLNISIRVGTEIPDRVRVHRLPPEIVSIEPQYRDYDYFTTEEEIVIVEPRTHRVVSTVPKDTSRARAEVRSGPASSDGMAGQTTANAGDNRAAPCHIMRRDSSGQLSDVSSTTVGSSRDRQNSIVVTVETQDQQSTQPIALDAPAGQIIVATQGQGDCQVIIEPQTNR
jgi:hypothetical protein